MAVEIRYLTAADRFIAGLEARHRAAIRADAEMVARLGLRAPVSLRTIAGHGPMWELRNGDYRTFFFIEDDIMWLLGACKKQDQRRTIATSAGRMRSIRGR